VKSGDRREKWNAFGTLLSSRIRLVSTGALDMGLTKGRFEVEQVESDENASCQ
jgi:hypothetical protein